MNKKFLMSTLMVALISAGLSAQETGDPLPDTDPGNGLEDELDDGLETDDPLEADEDVEEGVTDPTEDRDTGDTESSARDIDLIQLFHRLDTDGDGHISREEAQAAAEADRPEDAFPDLIDQFDDLDTDGSGDLNLAEFMDFEPSFHGVR